MKEYIVQLKTEQKNVFIPFNYHYALKSWVNTRFNVEHGEKISSVVISDLRGYSSVNIKRGGFNFIDGEMYFILRSCKEIREKFNAILNINGVFFNSEIREVELFENKDVWKTSINGIHLNKSRRTQHKKGSESITAKDWISNLNEINALINSNLNRKAENLGLKTGKLEIKNISIPKSHLLEIKRDSKLYTVSFDSIVMDGDLDALKIAYYCGLGSKNAFGLGFIE
jgi:CRISPR/Cas system endoribonuclease Cas6 (RAMP superfamily)